MTDCGSHRISQVWGWSKHVCGCLWGFGIFSVVIMLCRKNMSNYFILIQLICVLGIHQSGFTLLLDWHFQSNNAVTYLWRFKPCSNYCITTIHSHKSTTCTLSIAWSLLISSFTQLSELRQWGENKIIESFETALWRLHTRFLWCVASVLTTRLLSYTAWLGDNMFTDTHTKHHTLVNTIN